MGKKSRKSKPKSKRKGDVAAPSATAVPPAAAVSEPSSSSSPNDGMGPSAAQPSRAAVDDVPPAPPPGAVCWICLDGDPDERGKPIVRDCACRGDDSGFGHLSCLVGYAGTKTKELIEKGGKVDLFEPWRKCPTCRQNYQRRVAIDMAKSYVSFVEENCPSPGVKMKNLKLDGFKHILNVITTMNLAADFGLSAAFREEGKQAVNQMISEIERVHEITEEQREIQKLFAISALGIIAEDGTREGYDLKLQCLEKVRTSEISKGLDVTNTDINIKMTKARREGVFELSHHDKNEAIEDARNDYENITRECGEDAAYSEQRVELGLILAQLLYEEVCGLECRILLNDLGIVSRRVLGPDHPLTEEVERYRKHSGRTIVKVMTCNSMMPCDALSFNIDTGTYNVLGDLPVSGIYQLGINMFEMVPGTPVVCHGLKNAQHLNGKIGEVRRYDVTIRRYKVRFEETCLKPASVKGANLRILFDLPDKQ